MIGIDNNGVRDNDEEFFDTIKEAYLEMCRRFTFTPAINLSDSFSYDGKTFADRLADINAL